MEVRETTPGAGEKSGARCSSCRPVVVLHTDGGFSLEKMRISLPSRIPLLLQAGHYVFLLIGLTALLWAAFAYAEMPIYQFLANSRLDQMRQHNAPSAAGLYTEWTRNFSAKQRGAFHNAKRGASVSSGALIGRIEIPRIGLSTVLLEGADSRTLRLAAGHIPGTAFPGELGNVGIAGHRDTFFRSLQNIKENDVIRLTTAHGSYGYKVDSIEIVEPGDVDVLDRFSSGRRLTLVTCYPFRWIGPAPRRFVVSARGISAP